MLEWFKRLIFGEKKSEDPVPMDHRRRNAIIYYAVSSGREGLKRNDLTGAVLDVVRIMTHYGENPGWLEPMAADVISSRSFENAQGFVEGFACDEADAIAWLKENKL